MKVFVLSAKPQIIRWIRSAGLVSWGIFLGYFIASLIGVKVDAIPDSSHLENVKLTISNWFWMTLTVMSYELVGRWFVQQYQIVMTAVNSRDLITLLGEGIILAMALHIALIFAAQVWLTSPVTIWFLPIPILIILALMMLARWLALAVFFELKTNPNHHDR